MAAATETARPEPTWSPDVAAPGALAAAALANGTSPSFGMAMGTSSKIAVGESVQMSRAEAVAPSQRPNVPEKLYGGGGGCSPCAAAPSSGAFPGTVQAVSPVSPATTSQQTSCTDSKDSPYSTPKPERYYIGDREVGNSASVTAGGSRAGSRAAAHVDELQAAVTPSSGVSNGVKPSETSPKGMRLRLKTEYKELLRNKNAELVAKAEAKEELVAEMRHLRDKSTEEAQKYNELCDRLVGVGKQLKVELEDMETGPMRLQAELRDAEHQRAMLEADLQRERDELESHIEEKKRQLIQIRNTRDPLEKNLHTTESNLAWLEQDLEGLRKTQTQFKDAEKLKLQETENEVHELERKLQRGQQDFASAMAYRHNEEWQIKQRIDVEREKEAELREEVARMQEEFREVQEGLQRDVRSEAKESEMIDAEISKAQEENEEFQDLFVGERQAQFQEANMYLARMTEEVEHERAESLAEDQSFQTANLHANQLQQELLQLLEQQLLQQSGVKKLSDAERRQKSSRQERDFELLESELHALGDEQLEMEGRMNMWQQEADSANRGFLGFRCFRRRPDGPPPLPPPDGEPPTTRDVEKGNPAQERSMVRNPR